MRKHIFEILSNKKEKILGLGFIFWVFLIIYRIVPMTYDGWASKFAYASTGGIINFIYNIINVLYFTCNGRVISNIVCGIFESFTSEIPLDIFNSMTMVIIFHLLYKFYEKDLKDKKIFIYGSLLFTGIVLLISDNMRMEVLFYANMAYTVPIPLIILYYYLWKKGLSKKNNLYIFFLCLIGFSIGMWMEHIAVGFGLTISLGSIVLFLKKYKKRWKLLLPAVVTDLGVVLMMFAPGLNANRTIVSETPLLEVIFSNFKNLYVDIISHNLYLFLIIFIFLLLLSSKKENKKIIDYIFIIILSVINVLFLGTLIYRTFNITLLEFTNLLFPKIAYLFNIKTCLTMTFMILVLIIYGIFNIKNIDKKCLYLYLLGVCLLSLTPLLITPNAGARISSIGFFIFACIAILLFFELSKNEFNIKLIKVLTIVLIILALDKTILIGRRIYNVNIKRESIINSVIKKQEMNEWDYSKYVFIPIYKTGDMFRTGAICQDTIHYTAFLQAYGLNPRTNIIFSDHYVSAINEISIKNNKLQVVNNLNNDELIKYKITYGQDLVSFNEITETDWTKDNFSIKVKHGYYLIDIVYKYDKSSSEIYDHYEVYVN